MFWLFDENEQEEIRETVDKLVHALAPIGGNPQIDQLFPYVGRKDRRKAEKAIEILSNPEALVIEPFAGSGTFAYACANLKRNFLANEWEPYAHRMANAPWRLPDENSVLAAVDTLKNAVEDHLNYLYKTVCDCGRVHVLDSLFFDRDPLTFTNVTQHERLGPDGRTIAYRGKYKCPQCKRANKFFTEEDQRHLDEINEIALEGDYADLFSTELIENSRVNLTGQFTTYGNLFPHRSKLALACIWDGIRELDVEMNVGLFLQDAFLSILPQAKFKDYRSKSQDLHCPSVQLREVNIWYRFLAQIRKRFNGIGEYSFTENTDQVAISCLDYRAFFQIIEEGQADLVFTDPPWTDGNAYFEKAQLYHPWLNYKLSEDEARLTNEFVVTDAPTRREEHSVKRWWTDLDDFFISSYRILRDRAFLALFFRPIPASQWLANLNALKLYARKNGFEPILSIDVGSSDPSMRIQQSASFVFATDIIFLFVKLPDHQRRVFRAGKDIDHLVFQTAEELQEHIREPYTYKKWREFFSKRMIDIGMGLLNHPNEETVIRNLFLVYAEEVQPGLYLPKPITPYSGQVFDIPAIERIFTYIPIVINELTTNSDTFTYDSFLLKLAEFVENGTRMLIDQLGSVDIKRLIEPYAQPHDGGRWFERRSLPQLPEGLKNVYELDPYEFEAFVARLFEAQGFTDVVLAGRSGDRGVDVIGNDADGNGTVIQCKRWIGNVSATPIQRIHSFAVTRGAVRKILVTTSDYTPQAIQEAENTETELINGDRLEELIAQHMSDYFQN